MGQSEHPALGIGSARYDLHQFESAIRRVILRRRDLQQETWLLRAETSAFGRARVKTSEQEESLEFYPLGWNSLAQTTAGILGYI